MSVGNGQVTGIALTIGLNNVGPFYQGGAPVLNGCKKDANDVAALAAKQGFGTPTVLLDDQATVAAVTQAITDAAAKLQPGDIFLIHYSGHGMEGDLQGQTHDAFGNFSSCWCLFDQPLLNHDLYKLWFQFADSVRIVVLSDSCHSGSATRDFINRHLQRDLAAPVVATRDIPMLPPRTPIPRAIPPAAQAQIIAAHPNFFKAANQRIAATRSVAAAPEPAAAVLLLAGCLDNQTSGDMPNNGLFTGSVLQVWSDGAFQGNYTNFLDQVKLVTSDASGGAQTPRLFPVGNEVAMDNLVQDRPFTVD
jgi:metacaspase-1